jgi:hypothetical protein
VGGPIGEEISGPKRPPRGVIDVRRLGVGDLPLHLNRGFQFSNRIIMSIFCHEHFAHNDVAQDLQQIRCPPGIEMP